MLQKLILSLLCAAISFGSMGCMGYHRKPIADRQVLRDLQAIRLEGLGMVEGKRDDTAPRVDAAKSLSLEEAVAVGLYLNHHGATTCTEADPHCTVCPVLEGCQAGLQIVKGRLQIS